MLSRATVPVPTGTYLSEVTLGAHTTTYMKATYFVIERAVHTILLCAKNIRL